MRILLLMLASLSALGQSVKLPSLGIAIDMEKDSVAKAAGYGFIVESVAKCLSPRTVSDAQFETNLKTIKALTTKLYAVNVFMPGDLKLVGPGVDEQAVLNYAELVFKRCQRAGIDQIVWGSGGSRRVPEGFVHQEAKKQFISIAKKVAQLASRYSIRFLLEDLNSTETNFITKLSEALEIGRAVNEPNFRVCADIYHMLMENEPPSVIETGKDMIVHVDIAENKTRTPPGVNGENFIPYLKALKKIGYSNVIVLECRWADQAAQAKPAREYLQKQLEAAYAEK